MEELQTFYEGGPKTWEEAFPPVCIRSHWDPTQISQHVLPSHLIAPQEMDPRQSVRICTSYYERPGQSTISHKAMESLVPDLLPSPKIPQLLGPEYYRRPFEVTQQTATPPGGAASIGAPYSLYTESVMTESDLYRLDEPLTKCKERRYIPKSGVKDATNTLPSISQTFGLSPYATYVTETTGCRAADDNAAWNRSGRLFFNHTRLDRVYPEPHGPLACGKTA